METWPKDVGILAIEFVFPSQYVDQKELEEFDGVSTGKYTVGLGQSKMGFCSDREDIHSICLTVLHKLIEKNDLKFEQIGRLEVGTETIIDKSKSVKSVLMQLFEPYGVVDVEGIDTTNACYGGTAALFNAISWVESSIWDGRYAVVVAGDIAVYAKGPARPTGGAGAVAMLIGANAPLVFDRGLRASCMKNVYDFYKPDLSSEYPTVDSKLSIECYFSSLDACYQSYMKKLDKLRGDGKVKGLDNFDAMLLHSPFGKLARKGFAHLVLNDFLQNNEYNGFARNAQLQKYKNLKLEDTYFDRDVEKTFMELSQKEFDVKTKPCLFLPSVIGNTYTACLYAGLVSFLISKDVSEIAGNRIGLFSYGSGFASSMFSISVSKNGQNGSPLQKMISNLSHIKSLLAAREKVTPEAYDAFMEIREANCNKKPYIPQGSINHLYPGTYYLHAIDEMHRRSYKRIPNSITKAAN